MKNDVKTSIQGIKEGIYKEGPSVNRARSWITTTNAIWYVPEFDSWAIGGLSGIGNTIRGITSTGGTGDNLFEVPSNQWLYWDGSAWIEIDSGDLNIQELNTCDQSKYFTLLQRLTSLKGL